jgi:hypothetical protein
MVNAQMLTPPTVPDPLPCGALSMGKGQWEGAIREVRDALQSLPGAEQAGATEVQTGAADHGFIAHPIPAGIFSKTKRGQTNDLPP